MTCSLSPNDHELIFSLAERITGSCQSGRCRREILVNNVARRIDACGKSSLVEYLEWVEAHEGEFKNLVSALTIHTTEWFREAPHYQLFERHVEDFVRSGGRKYEFLSVGCSTGQEAYSFALVLESFREKHQEFDYSVRALDIDPICIEIASRGIYSCAETGQIPLRFRKELLLGSGKSEGFFTLSKEIRERCQFFEGNVFHSVQRQGTFDFISFRNVLIYFSPEQVSAALGKLRPLLGRSGILCLGHSETIEPRGFRLRSIGSSSYIPEHHFSPESSSDRMRVLVVDDSATSRHFLTELLQEHCDVAAVGSADEATRFLEIHSVDLVTLDLQMPVVDGLTWLQQQRRTGFPTPVVIVSEAAESEAVQVLGALEKGAQDYVEKSVLRNAPKETIARLVAIAHEAGKRGAVHAPGASKGHVKSAHSTSGHRSTEPTRPVDVILVGASTGGTEALSSLLKDFPQDAPPVMVVQHISRNFCKPFAERLAKVSGLQLGEPEDGSPLRRGHIYLAWGEYHIAIEAKNGVYLLRVLPGLAGSGHVPGVDVLFRSGLSSASNIAAILLTGMGKDGAQGMTELRRAGAFTMAQDEHSCVVFGMPREAIAAGGVCFVGSLAEIREKMNQVVRAGSAVVSPRGAVPNLFGHKK